MRPAPWLAIGLVLGGCQDTSPAESLKGLAPQPLPTLGRGAADAGRPTGARSTDLEAAPVYGRKPPKDAIRLTLSGQGVDSTRITGAKRVLLAPDSEVYLAQALPLLAALDDGGVETWLSHPDGAVAFRLSLRDEASFQAWLEEPKPGKIRVIQRADGYELATNIGKLPGGDPNGPSVPIRNGQLDVATLRHGLGLLRGRFKKAEDACIVPSYGTELQKIAMSLSGFFEGPDQPIFDELCLVYPRPPKPKDGG